MAYWFWHSPLYGGDYPYLLVSTCTLKLTSEYQPVLQRERAEGGKKSNGSKLRARNNFSEPHIGT